MKTWQRLSALALALLLSLFCAAPTSAAAETVLTDKATGITVRGVFPSDSTYLDVRVDTKSDASPYAQKIELTLLYTIFDDECGDVDTYDGYNGVTVSLPYKKANMYVVGFDDEGNPVDTKAKYTDGCYVFSTNYLSGCYWITALNPSAKPSTDYAFCTFRDKETGITVRGSFPKHSYLVVNDVTEHYVYSEQPQYGAVFWHLTVYSGFQPVSPNGTVEITIPGEKADQSVRLLRTDELTDEENDPDINYFDRWWYDTKSQYQNGRYVFYAGNVGTFAVGSDAFYADIGGGERRVTPKTEELAPFRAGVPSFVWWVGGVAVAFAGAVVAFALYRRKKGK